MTRTTGFETLNGFPREEINLANWRTRPYSFWSFRHVSEMVRSARIGSGDGAALPAPVDNPDLLSRRASPEASASALELLTLSQTDSFIVSKNGAIVCEWIGANHGIGYLLIQSMYEFDTPRLFASILTASFIAITGFAIVSVLEKIVIRWDAASVT